MTTPSLTRVCAITAGISLVLAVPMTAMAANQMALSEACEIAVARSALPKRLRADASVYVLKGEHYEKVVDSEGPFTCLVERNHPNSVVPQCMDRAGVDSVLPALIERSEMTVAGVDFETIQANNQQKMADGSYHPAGRAGISYMMSDYNYTYIESAGKVMKIAPHVMFYAPGVTNQDVGGSFQSMTENIGTPFVFREGMHGYMIVYTEHRADRNEVAEACAGQLGEAPPSFDPFPKG